MAASGGSTSLRKRWEGARSTAATGPSPYATNSIYGVLPHGIDSHPHDSLWRGARVQPAVGGLAVGVQDQKSLSKLILARELPVGAKNDAAVETALDYSKGQEEPIMGDSQQEVEKVGPFELLQSISRTPSGLFFRATFLGVVSNSRPFMLSSTLNLYCDSAAGAVATLPDLDHQQQAAIAKDHQSSIGFSRDTIVSFEEATKHQLVNLAACSKSPSDQFHGGMQDVCHFSHQYSFGKGCIMWKFPTVSGHPECRRSLMRCRMQKCLLLARSTCVSDYSIMF